MKRFATMLVILACAVGMVSAQQKVGAYTTLEEPLAKELFDLFQKETGIQVNWQRLAGGEAESAPRGRESQSPGLYLGRRRRPQSHERQAQGFDRPLQVQDGSRTPPLKYRDSENYWIGLYMGPHLLHHQQQDRQRAGT